MVCLLQLVTDLASKVLQKGWQTTGAGCCGRHLTGTPLMSLMCDIVNCGHEHLSRTELGHLNFTWLLSLSFLCSNEYYPADLQVAPSQDLRRKGRGGAAEDTEEEPAAGDDEEVEEEGVPQDETSPKKKTRRAAAK